MLLIKNGNLLTMVGNSYERGDILIEDGKIRAIGENLTVGPDVEVIDATGFLVMPGIIEAHCHIGISEQNKGFEGDDSNEITDPVTATLKAIDAINPMDPAFDDAAQAGITSVMVGPGSANVVGGQWTFMKTKGSRIMDRLLVFEPSAMKVAFGENPKKNYSNLNKMPSTRMGNGALLRKALFDACTYKKKKEKAKEAGEEFEEEFEKEAWLPVLRREIPLKAHVHRVDDIVTAIRIAKYYNLRMTLDHCSEGHLIADYVAESGFPAIVGPALTARTKIEVQNVSFKTAGVLHEAGVKVAITTDHPVTPIQYLPKCAGFAAKEGLGIAEGLRAITINAAEICGIADRVGSLEVGKDGDIAIFTDNPMETFSRTAYTIIEGQIVYRNKALLEPKNSL